MNKNRKKMYLIIISIVVIASVLILTINLSHGLWTNSHTQADQNILNPGCLEISFASGSPAINATNSFPITDIAGKNGSGYEFTVKNTCTIVASFKVILNELSANTLAESRMRVYVEGDKIVNPKDLDDFTSSDVVKSSTDSKEYSSARIILTDFLPAASKASGTDGGEKTYTLKLWIGENASLDQTTSQKFSGTIAINASPVSTNSSYLAENILANNQLQTSTPDFTRGYPTKSSGSTLSGLYATEDDDGTAYYFRGDKDLLNNNVRFANKDWKILRINGDGTIRLILNDSIGSYHYFSAGSGVEPTLDDHVGYTYNGNAPCTKENPCQSELNGSTFTNSNNGTNVGIKNILENWYIQNLKNYNTKVAYGRYCNDTSMTEYVETYGTYYFGSSVVTLKCPDPTDWSSSSLHNYGGSYKLKIGLVSTDELIMAGLSLSSSSSYVATDKNFMYTDYQLMTMSPDYSMPDYRAVMYKGDSGYVTSIGIALSSEVLPVINVSGDTRVSSGNGTEEKPYSAY